jgi:hypothetical protein
MSRARTIVLALAIVPAVSPVLGARTAQEPDPFEVCRKQFAEAPDDYESSMCFYDVQLRTNRWDEGARLFEGLMAAHPLNFWLPLAYGHMHRTRDADRTVALYRRSADGFQGQQHAEGEITARSSLRDVLVPRGRLDEAAREVERIVERGAAADNPVSKARAWMAESQQIQDSGGDLGRALGLLRRAEEAVIPDGPYRLRRTCLTLLGLLAMRLGRHDEAIAIFRDLDLMAAAEGDRQTEAAAQYNLLNTTATKEYALPTAGARGRLLQMAERALATGTDAGHLIVRLRSHRTIAELLTNEPGGRAKALEHMERCLALAEEARQPLDEAVCAWVEAWLVRDENPSRARRAELRALDATTRANNPRTHAFSAGRHMRLSWETRPRAEAIRNGLAAIDTIETLRRLQEEPETSAELFAAWTLDYYWLSGRLLQDTPSAAEVDLAFGITERMRARTLLDQLARGRTPADPSHPAVERHRSVLLEISAVQRQLMNPALGEDDRRDRLQALERLERDAQDARRELSMAFPAGPSTPLSFATVGAVQSALADDEALLSFQVGLWETYEGFFGGGSWLVVLTRDGRTVHRLPDRTTLSSLLPVFSGLIERGDGLEAASAVRLYDELLRDALGSLAPKVRRLIIVPDGALHRLPFDALRPAPDAQPLGAALELVTVPSATLWLRWRTRAPDVSGRRALVVADPDVGATGEALERNAALGAGLRLGRLPYARRESRSVERHVGSADSFVGAAASESLLKQQDLGAYSILHFAAHAIADDVRPERSAVLLSPGADSEDGLLQAREIEQLDLDGRIIVLSACQTASGAVLSGEGVLSLARAFFEAGADAVIGSRWPIRDADAASFFDAFYRHLGQGASLSSAVHQARLEAIAAGQPASAWAGLVLMGNGALVPFPDAQPPAGGRSGGSPALAWIALIAVAAASVTLIVLGRPRRRVGL